MTVFAPQILFSWEEVLKELNETANNEPMKIGDFFIPVFKNEKSCKKNFPNSETVQFELKD